MSYSGRWDLTIKSPMGDRELCVELSQDGDSLSGTASGEGNTEAITKGRVKGGNAQFDVKVSVPMPIKLSFDLEADGAAIGGKCKLGMFGSAPVTGSKRD